ncbi:uncharacterized protein LOC120638674 [Ornithorhynchus anatinus]|uniref:uncharacterized protein LOC120638674 n=1 Tax=Ornithorhynchus anatinus TaxID=9258 RepID=UPI0019D46870|nr:uncharacterized protein LOC120638674 [Ornithorhynchus anatinus]
MVLMSGADIAPEPDSVIPSHSSVATCPDGEACGTAQGAGSCPSGVQASQPSNKPGSPPFRSGSGDPRCDSPLFDQSLRGHAGLFELDFCFLLSCGITGCQDCLKLRLEAGISAPCKQRARPPLRSSPGRSITPRIPQQGAAPQLRSLSQAAQSGLVSCGRSHGRLGQNWDQDLGFLPPSSPVCHPLGPVTPPPTTKGGEHGHSPLPEELNLPRRADVAPPAPGPQ